MPAAAVIGAAAITAGSTALAASKNSKAIKRSTQAQSEGNAASLAEQRRQFDIASGNLNPFIRSGTGANSMINALLGVPQNNAGSAQIVSPQQYAQGQNALSPAAFAGSVPDSGMGYGSIQPNADANGAFVNYAGSANIGGEQPMAGFDQNMVAQNVPGGVMNADPRKAANDAFDVFRNSTGYQFRVNEGQDAINTGFAARGLLQSGAALKSLENFRQNTASAEFGNYLGALQGQQNIGFGAASAQAGVGQSFANNVTQLNTANANNLANAAVARANNSNALIGGIAGAAGSVLGGMGGSSYGSPFGAQTGISFNPNNARNVMSLGGFG